MVRLGSFLFRIIFTSLLLNLVSSSSTSNTDDDRKVYIVYMGALPSSTQNVAELDRLSILEEVVEGSLVEDVLVRNYKRSFNGFAARLTQKEKQKLEGKKGIVSVFPSIEYQLHTTRSWDFMGLTEKVTRNPTVESDIVIGMIDTGVWLDSPSLSDKGFSPPPKKWKGVCQGGTNFTCNNKIIGARYYGSGADSAVDVQGHGTHTASTAAGNLVNSASFFGLANGTARGAVPSARLAVYSVCNPMCDTQNLLSAFDDAIADGVDIISISIGSYFALDFVEDPVALGSFHATEKGILVVQSAGNSGPRPSSVSSTAPWLLSVAASSIDRLFIDKVFLGNGKELKGSSINTFDLNQTMFPLVYNECSTRHCKQVNDSAKGQIVVTDSFGGMDRAYEDGAKGAIVKVDRPSTVASVYPFPVCKLGSDEFEAVLSYIKNIKNPVGTILKSEVITDYTAPVVTNFSSRGPNSIAPDILKPDLTAPGVTILAAFSIIPPVTGFLGEKRHSKFNIISGTSMSCPHVAGAAAYVKSFHPDWPHSFLKSALMTTSKPMKLTENLDGEFAYGSGHINPVKATDPGLVYETSTEDYIQFLCGIKYEEGKIKTITGQNVTCPKGAGAEVVRNLNYPTFTAKVRWNESFSVSFNRTVTNVGPAKSTYNADISSNPKFSVEVNPKVLSFTSSGEKLPFVATVSGQALGETNYVSESLTWSDGVHKVRSPIVIWI